MTRILPPPFFVAQPFPAVHSSVSSAICRGTACCARHAPLDPAESSPVSGSPVDSTGVQTPDRDAQTANDNVEEKVYSSS
jgi:hypothetical protein